MTTPTPHALEVARVTIADVQRTGYTIECSHGGYTALINAVAALIDRERDAARREAIEECALLHEQVNIDDHREPMAVVIEYRDKIRSLLAPANGESK